MIGTEVTSVAQPTKLKAIRNILKKTVLCFVLFLVFLFSIFCLAICSTFSYLFSVSLNANAVARARFSRPDLLFCGQISCNFVAKSFWN